MFNLIVKRILFFIAPFRAEAAAGNGECAVDSAAALSRAGDLQLQVANAWPGRPVQGLEKLQRVGFSFIFQSNSIKIQSNFNGIHVVIEVSRLFRELRRQVVHYELGGLRPVDAARLFLRRAQRPLRWKEALRNAVKKRELNQFLTKFLKKKMKKY